MDVFKKHIGEIFENRYKIIRNIGSGGMALVYEAVDLASKDGRHVAIKMLRDDISDDPQALKRFVNESRAVAMLNHPNIVKISHISVKTERKFIVMEYIDGITLRQYMNCKGALGWREAIAFVAQILLALDHAHMKGVIHRDIKPQNIMVMQGGVIKVTDFGIAKIPNAETVTVADHAVGTIYYISPEQARGKKVDARSDLYSLGVMFYEMVTGRLPFVAENSLGVMLKHISDPPRPPRELQPALPLGVEQIILCAMEKDVEKRYQSASQILRHLYRVAKDPTVIFPPYRPPRTPTADVAIRRTTVHPDGGRTGEAALPPFSSGVMRATTDTYPSTKNHALPASRPDASQKVPAKAPRRPASPVSFSAVILVCMIFVLVALIGFFALYCLLSGGKVAEAPCLFAAASRLSLVKDGFRSFLL